MRAYVEKMRTILGTEGIRSISEITLGYDLEGFGKKGDRIWQVLFASGFEPQQFRGIVWVHAGTGQVRFVTGAWESKSTSEKAK